MISSVKHFEARKWSIVESMKIGDGTATIPIWRASQSADKY